MPRLVLLRHAAAEPVRPDDLSRALVAAGRADAAALREVLAGLAPEVAVVSTAARAQQTWRLADPGGVPVVLDERVYEASVADLRAVLAEQTAGCVVLVGHNPAIERLAWELAPGEDTDRGMRPAGLAGFEVADWELTAARLTAWR